jgi:FtsP/CotA-like multicopper oxidase with cupredoxin domain
VRIRLRNELEQPTSIHWHGIRIDNAMDGVAGLTQDAVEPGETFDYVFTVPDAGTFWYHSHNRSWEQVERGLYGALIVDEPEPLFDADRDITLVLDDWRVSQSGRIDEDFGNLGDWSHAGRLGNWLTVNGRTLPEIPLAPDQATRVRLINAANARILELDLKGIGAEIIGYDGQALPEPRKPAYNPVLLGPGQRIDIIVTPSSDGTLPLREMSNTPFEFARFIVGEASGRINSSPPALVTNDLPEPDLANARTFDLLMEGWHDGRHAGRHG